jgi:RNA polymerase sigma-70 factor (ECF subfamily)
MTADPAIPRLVEHLFRHAWGRMVAGLVRVFGPSQLQRCEDVVQEALTRALQVWPFQGVPAEPEAWLVQVARNCALDRVRRDRMAAQKEQELAHWAAVQATARAGVALPAEVADDTLRMMFLCCHPTLPFPSRVALTLKTLCGFGVPEIARAFLAREGTVAQRLVRAKEQLRQEQIAFELPAAADLQARLDDLLAVLYLLFNEGYAASRGAELVRPDLVHEALRLCRLLAQEPALGLHKVHALLALMLLQGARLPARRGVFGELLTLAQQDRSLWRRDWIAEGMLHFARSVGGDELTQYHLEAAIASCHAAAPNYAATDWAAIVRNYDRLLQVSASPVVALNRAIALAKAAGPAAGLAAVDAIAAAPELQSYHLLPASRGMLLWQLGRIGEAVACFRQAAALPCSEPEAALLRERAARCARGEAVGAEW